MKKRWFSIILLFLLFSLTVGSVSAQDYLFMVEREEVNLYVNEDGSASIEYTLDFVNLPGSHAIDFVDIGLPNDNYDQSSIDAKINGIPILHIQPSEYVSPGIELGLGGDAIPSDQTGQVHVMIGTVRDILYNSDIEDYASIEFSPSWFGEQYCFGDTDLTFTIFLPAGMNSEEPRYHEPQNWVGSTDPNESGFD